MANVPETPKDNLESARPIQDFEWPSEYIATTMRMKTSLLDVVLTRASTEFHLTLKNRMTPSGKPGRKSDVIFRANHSGFGKRPWVDNIRLQYLDDNHVPVVGFAKCLGFFSDDSNNNHVAIQWYKLCGRLSLDRVARMCKVELMESY